MSTEFEDDCADGGGRIPTVAETVKVRDYLKSRNHDFSVRPVAIELQARNFKASIATVSRRLNGREGGNPPPERGSVTTDASSRNKARRQRRKIEPPPEHAPDAPPLNLELKPEVKNYKVEISDYAALIAQSNSSTYLAIEENRRRMAFNIIVMELALSEPRLLLLDPRGAAALIDALTIAVKHSGGASIDITVPTGNSYAPANSNGHGQMKDITPAKTPLAVDFENFRATQRRSKQANGEGT